MPHSSLIASVTYNTPPDTLYIEFVNGSVYAYDRADSGLYLGLLEADSPGSFFHENLRHLPARQLAPRRATPKRARAAPRRPR